MVKKTIIFGVIFLLLSTSCFFDYATYPKTDVQIDGSENLATETRDIPFFHSVCMATTGNVFVSYGDEQVVTVETNDNLLEYIETTVRDDKLCISIEENVQINHMTLTVTIMMTDLEELIATSAGNIIGTNQFMVDWVGIETWSAGDISLDLDVAELTSSILSAGDINLRGSAGIHYTALLSAGELHAFDLETDTTYAAVCSAGDGEVTVHQLLDAEINSVGSLFYRGNPVIRCHVTSLGDLVHVN